MDVLVLNFSQESRQKRHGRQSFAAEVCTMTAYTLDRAAGARLLAPLALALLLLVAMSGASTPVLAQSERSGAGELRTADE